MHFFSRKVGHPYRHRAHVGDNIESLKLQGSSFAHAIHTSSGTGSVVASEGMSRGT